jgi:hypothetical protein
LRIGSTRSTNPAHGRQALLKSAIRGAVLPKIVIGTPRIVLSRSGLLKADDTANTPMAAIAVPKISFETLDMISSSAGGQQDDVFVILAQKIGLHRRKFHHAFARRSRLRRISRSCGSCDVRAPTIEPRCIRSQRTASHAQKKGDPALAPGPLRAVASIDERRRILANTVAD